MISNRIKSVLYSKIIILFIAFTACGKSRDEAKEQPVSFAAPTDYDSELARHRGEQDALFRGPKSPLEDSLKINFAGINYYPPDTNYRVVATVEKIKNGNIFKMEATGNIADEFKTLARLKFNLNGMDMSLEVYENQDLKKSGVTFYFIPFLDQTNGKETYGGGRYLEVPSIDGEKVILDFNYAYQPYCTYNHNYSCPIPPAINRLPIEIKAGEKLPAY